jgi:hypothetical protein
LPTLTSDRTDHLDRSRAFNCSSTLPTIVGTSVRQATQPVALVAHRRAAAAPPPRHAPSRRKRRHSMRRTYNFQRPGTRSRLLPALQWCRSAALVGCLPVAVVGSAWDGGQPAGGVAAQATRDRPEPAHVALRLVGHSGSNARCWDACCPSGFVV